MRVASYSCSFTANKSSSLRTHTFCALPAIIVSSVQTFSSIVPFDPSFRSSSNCPKHSWTLTTRGRLRWAILSVDRGAEYVRESRIG
eukprot:2189553-Rhodomonas_salina.1